MTGQASNKDREGPGRRLGRRRAMTGKAVGKDWEGCGERPGRKTGKAANSSWSQPCAVSPSSVAEPVRASESASRSVTETDSPSKALALICMLYRSAGLQEPGLHLYGQRRSVDGQCGVRRRDELGHGLRAAALRVQHAHRDQPDFSDDLFLTKNWAGWSKLQVSNNSPTAARSCGCWATRARRSSCERDGGPENMTGGNVSECTDELAYVYDGKTRQRVVWVYKPARRRQWWIALRVIIPRCLVFRPKNTIERKSSTSSSMQWYRNPLVGPRCSATPRRWTP